ncbi:GAF domain-containing protein [Streptacidiphilus jiangxiensis]|uniref:Signal transduction histidine kinase n=1 Tax=Streptacidiphilus jiangxiensis TaxID=235985 RepID=A0A1H7J9I4_STRJI|nr:GAF domain-containing protein [Streptacidiphilus jiangxiensis]SEK69925.1 Signal transduction histidine kinase [Streptacidiphilus jiangxiensis]
MATGDAHFIPDLGSLEVDDLVSEVAERLHAVAAVNDRMRELLEAVVAVSSGLNLHATLQRIASAAADLVDAEYAAVGVLAPHTHGLSDFIQVGITSEQELEIGGPPCGLGLLGYVTEHPEPLRLEDLTKHPSAVGFPHGHPVMHTFLSVPVRVRGHFFGTLYLAEKHNGRHFSGADQQVVEALAAAAGVAIENARLYEEGRRRERWIAASREVTNVMLTAEDAAVSLTTTAELLRDLAGAALGMILLPTEDGGMRVAHASGEAADLLIGEPVPRTERVRQLLAGDTVMIADMRTDSDIRADIRQSFGPSMALPLQSSGRVLGAVSVWRGRDMPPFTEAERELAEGFAAQAALALRLVEGQQNQQRLAVYQDRDRIARDLHDLVIQRLFATGMMMESAARLAEVPEVKVRISKAVDELDATIQEVRTTIYALQHEDTPEGGEDLRKRVLRECAQASGPLGFKPSVTFVGPVEVMTGESIVRQLVAALREMLSNAARHAEASRVDVVVDCSAHIDLEGRLIAGKGRPAVVLTVSDDGVGIPEGGRRSGLRNLADRARNLGGDAWFAPGLDGRGTRVFWTAGL